MPATTQITSEMLIAELERINGHMEKHYPAMVEQKKLTPWERDHRMNCNKEMLSVMRQLHMLEKMHGMPFTEILKQIHSK